MAILKKLPASGLLPTYCPGTHNRGMSPHQGVVNALLRGEKPEAQALTVDVVIAELCRMNGIKTLKEMRMKNKLLPTPRAGNPGSRPNRKGGRILAEEITNAT